MSKLKSLFLPATILIASLIIGAFIYAGLERQQEIKTAQDRQEYIGKRKIDCYEILIKEKERNKDVGVSAEYFEPSNNPFESKDFNDACRIQYIFLSGGKTIEEYVSY